MKTIDEISQIIKAAFVANPIMQIAYQLDITKTFDEQFAGSSVEANIINVIATAMASQEFFFECYKEDIEALLLKTYPGTVAWYHDLVLNFEYNGSKIIQYAAVVEQYPHLLVKVNGSGFSVFGSSSDQLVALRSYLGQKKFAGTYISVMSYAPDDVKPSLKVWLDAQIYDSSGRHLVDGDNKVDLAIDAYLSAVKYNGSMNKIKLIDAIQSVEGVSDVLLEEIEITRADASVFTIPDNENNYQSQGGAFASTNKNMTYVLS